MLSNFIKIITLTFILLTLPAMTFADSKGNCSGWDKGSTYNRLYDYENRDMFRGYIKKIIKIKPMNGMSEGIGIIAEDCEDGEQVVVHLGPESFVSPLIKDLVPGTMVKFYGVLVEIGGQYAYMCSKIQKDGDHQYKFRKPENGTPLWAVK